MAQGVLGGGVRPLDIAYSEDGKFSSVLGYLNPQFEPGRIAETKAKWDAYAAGKPQDHRFGRFAAYLLKELFSTAGYPALYQWLKDCTYYKDKPIDATSIQQMSDDLRDNMQEATPKPMFFQVKPTDAGVHRVDRKVFPIDGNDWIEVTMYCPVDSAFEKRNRKNRGNKRAGRKGREK